MHLEEEERLSYEWHMEEMRYQASMYYSSYNDGRLDGIEKGREEGLKEGSKAKAIKIARIMKEDQEPIEKMQKYTQLSSE